MFVVQVLPKLSYGFQIFVGTSFLSFPIPKTVFGIAFSLDGVRLSRPQTFMISPSRSSSSLRSRSRTWAVLTTSSSQ